MNMDTLFPVRETKHYEREPEHKCPFCYTRLNKKRVMYVWKSVRKWFLRNREAVARQVVLHELYHHPEIELNPDLLFALRAEAGCDGLDANDLLNEILDSYFHGRFEVLRRRKERRTRVLKSS